MKKTLLLLFGAVVMQYSSAQDASWRYDFGSTAAAPYTSTTYSTAYLPAPQAQGGNAGVRASSAAEGAIELVAAGIAGGSGAELKITGGTTVTGAKFGLAPFNGTSLAFFECRITVNTGTNGRFVLYFGNGTNFSNAGGINLGQTFAALRFSPATSAVNLDWLLNNVSPNYTTSGLTQTMIAKGQSYQLKFFMNNSNSSVSYEEAGTHNLAPGTFDVWLDDTKILANADPGAGMLPQGTIINGMNLLNVGAGSSAPTMYIDNISYRNFLNATPPSSRVDSIATRYRNWLIGENVDYSNALVNDRYQRFIQSGIAARDLTGYDLANPGPAWNLANSTDHNAFTNLVTGKLMRLVFLYHLRGPAATPNPDYHRPSLRDTILNIFDYVKAKGISNSTTFGSETFLRTGGYAASIFLMKPELAASDELAHHMGALAKICSTNNPFLTSPYADEIRAMVPHRLCYALAQDNSSTRDTDMMNVRNFLNASLMISKGWSGTIKADFSTYHHLGPYSNSYGIDALHQASILNKILMGTSYELSDTAQKNLKAAVLAYRQFSIDFTMPRGLAGRSPGSVNSYEVLRPALAYLYLADPAANTDAGKEFMRLWGLSSSSNLALQRQNQLSITLVHTLGSMQDMVDALNAGLTPSIKPLEGQYSFPYAGLSVHKYNGWQSSVKGTSKHVWHFENGAVENRFGAYSSAGAMELLARGSLVVPDSNGLSLNGWDWAHIPGTTVANVPFATMANFVMREFNGKNFLAHAALDNNGVFAMDYRDFNSPTGMTALKTYFFFKDKIFCLGSNIKDINGTYPIHTTLFQTSFFDAANSNLVNGVAATGTNYTFNQTGGGLWATDAVGNGFVVPATPYNPNPITITRSNQSSPLHSNTGTASGNFVKAYIDHGTAPQAGTYQYAVQIQGGAGTQHLADNFSDYFQVLQQDTLAHIVKYVPDSIYSYALFDTAAAPAYDQVLKTDKPVVVMTQKLEEGNLLKISVTNPNLGLLAPDEAYSWRRILDAAQLFREPKVDIVKITIAGKWLLQTPAENISATVMGDSTVISFSTINGLTIQASMVKASLHASVKESATRSTDTGTITYIARGGEFDITATGNCGGITCSYVLSGATVGSGTASLANAAFNKGVTSVTWTAADGCSSVTTSFMVTVVDMEAPVIASPAPLTANQDAGQCSAAVALIAPQVTDNSGAVTLSNDAPGRFPVGVTTVTWMAKDSSGNTSSATQTVTVTDLELPVPGCPAAQSFCYKADGNYTIPAATASDNCGIGQVSYQITGATTRSGSGFNASGTFNVGSSLIKWTMTDIHGNTATCETPVTVGSQLNVSVPDVFAVSPGGNANTIYLGYGPAALTFTASPSGGIPPYSYAWSNGTTTAANAVNPSVPGGYQFPVSVTDALGCTVSVSKNVTVVDVRCGADKIVITHKPQTDHNNTLCIQSDSVADHLAHGCWLGEGGGANMYNLAISAKSQAEAFSVQAVPNPTSSAFRLSISGHPGRPVHIRVVDLTGKTLQQMIVSPGQPVVFGKELTAGTYLAEVRQGDNRKVLKLIKL